MPKYEALTNSVDVVDISDDVKATIEWQGTTPISCYVEGPRGTMKITPAAYTGFHINVPKAPTMVKKWRVVGDLNLSYGKPVHTEQFFDMEHQASGCEDNLVSNGFVNVKIEEVEVEEQ